MILRGHTATVSSLATAVLIFAAVDLSAQIRPKPPAPKPVITQPPRPKPPAFVIRGFGEGGLDKFAATKSFNAIFGRDSGPVFGGGGEVVVLGQWFARVSAWRFKDNGERALRLENQTFKLGIPLSVTIIPIEMSGGYRFALGRRRIIIPYVGAGVSSYSYKERSQFAQGDENVNERFTGYQILGGVEYRLHRWIGVAGEIQYATVPDSLGAGGLSEEFREKDLGGLIVRARVLFGR